MAVSTQSRLLGACRDAVRTSQPVSASKVDRNSTPASRADPTPPRADPALSSRAASSLHRSHEHRAPAKYSTSQHTQPDSSHGHGLGHRSAAHRDAYHAREHSHPRSSSRDIRRERAHGRYVQVIFHATDSRSFWQQSSCHISAAHNLCKEKLV